jgi:hypothetical protein
VPSVSGECEGANRGGGAGPTDGAPARSAAGREKIESMAYSAVERAKRNLTPHKVARVAMFLFGQRYAAQVGGSMDFWDALPERDKQTCREVLQEIERAPKEFGDDATGEFQS